MDNSSADCSGRPANPLRVVIADDMELIRIGLRHALEIERDLTVVGAAEDGRAALKLCERLRPDLALLDERMPEMDGLMVARAIKERHPSIRVIILSPQGDLRYRAGALKAGADGWLLKNVSCAKLAAALRRVHRGETLFSEPEEAELLCAIAGLGPEQGRSVQDQLTPRELDVLRLLIKGQTNLQIANVLSLSRGTVKTYVEQIIAKLHVTSRTHAAVRALELGLLQTIVE